MLNARLTKRVEELEYLAYHDPLTGLRNRNWMNRYLTECQHLQIYFIDINNLREINKLGHTQGDAHIKKCVLDIMTKTKVGDVFIRYAGDEFVLLSNTPGLIETNDTYSVGWTLRWFHNNIMEAIERADMNMIQEKIKK